MAEKRQKKCTENRRGRHAAQRKGPPVGVIVGIVAALLLVLGALGVCGWAHFCTDVYPNVRLDGLALGGMSPREAADALVAAGIVDTQDRTLTVCLPQGGTLALSGQASGAIPTAEDAARVAYSYGRDGGFFKNGLRWLQCAVTGAELDARSAAQLDERYIRAAIKEAALKADEAIMGSDMRLDDTQIHLVKGIGKVLVDEEALYAMVTEALQRGDYSQLHYTPETQSDAGVDFEKLYEAVYRASADAFYTKEDGVTVHVVGRDFDLDAAKKLWEAAAPGETITIPLVLTEPAVTDAYLEEKLFADELGARATGLGTSSKNRLNNVQLACAAIDGLVLMPGEEFSYNEALGERTVEKGYKGAGAYVNGEVVTEIGGGICQVSSTLYCAALYANLQITARTNHYFGVDYLPAGLDATVSWGGPEFKFVNSRAWPVMLRAAVDEDAWKVSVSIYGTDEDGSYVQINTSYKQEEDGYSTVSYRLVYDQDGNLLSRKQEARSRYYYHKEDEEEPSPSPSPSPTPEPSPSPTPETSPSPTPETPPVSETDLIEPTGPVTPPATEPPEEYT